MLKIIYQITNFSYCHSNMNILHSISKYDIKCPMFFTTTDWTFIIKQLYIMFFSKFFPSAKQYFLPFSFCGYPRIYPIFSIFIRCELLLCHLSEEVIVRTEIVWWKRLVSLDFPGRSCLGPRHSQKHYLIIFFRICLQYEW